MLLVALRRARPALWTDRSNIAAGTNMNADVFFRSSAEKAIEHPIIEFDKVRQAKLRVVPGGLRGSLRDARRPSVKSHDDVHGAGREAGAYVLLTFVHNIIFKLLSAHNPLDRHREDTEDTSSEGAITA